MLFVVRRDKSNKADKLLKWGCAECDARSLKFAIYYTQGVYAQDSCAISDQAKQYTKVVVIGGDGTLHLVVNALAGSDCPIALLSCGTGNDFARGFHCDFHAWQQSVFARQSEYIDLGKVNERFFINVAGIGFDAEVVKRLQSQSSYSAFSYTWQSIKLLFSFKAKSLEGVFAGKKQQYSNLVTIFANHKYFGGGLAIAPQAKLNDGLLACYRMPSGGFFANLRSFVFLLLKKQHKLNALQHQLIDNVIIKTPGLAIEADGELIGVTPARIEAAPLAVKFCFPKKRCIPN